MTTIIDWLSTLGTTSLDLFWKPALVWTLVSLPLYVGLRCWRKAPPLMHYHAHLALLLALPLSLILAPYIAFPTSPAPLPVVTDVVPLPMLETDALLPTADVVIQAAPLGFTWTLAHTLGMFALIGIAWSAFLVVRMLYLAYALRMYRHGLASVEEARVHTVLYALAGEMGIETPIALRATTADATPMTFGWRHPVIVLPTTLLDDEAALRITLIHELIHIRRRDYAVSWVVRLIGSLFVIHPGVWLLRRRIEQYREISCDAEALTDREVNTVAYAELLLRFSPFTDFAGPTALRMVERDSTLKQRIRAMKRAVRFPSSVRLRRWSLPLAAALLLIPALFAACATKTTTNSETVIVNAEASYDEHAVQDVITLEGRLLYNEAREEVLAERAQIEAVQEAHERRERVVAELQLVEAQNALVELKREHDYEGTLRRLNLQMAYLKEEIKKTSEGLDILLKATSRMSDFSQAQRAEYELQQRRLDLLNSMYMQRLEQYETVKMEQFTQEALGENVAF